MNMNIGGLDMRHYEKNTLATVIFRVDFINPIKIEDDTLHKACLAIYPVVQSQVVKEQTVTTNFNEKGEMNVTRDVNSYQNKKYSNRQLTRYITVSPKFVLSEVKDYTSYTEISATFSAIFEAIRSANPDAVISRIGMRYVNQIDLSSYKPSARKNYVKSGLFESVYDGVIADSAQARTQHLAEIVVDDFRIRCVTGLFNPDYPAVIKRNVVTMDFDAFIQGNVNSSEVTGYLDKFHGAIQQLFEASILAKQREQMGMTSDE